MIASDEGSCNLLTLPPPHACVYILDSFWVFPKMVFEMLDSPGVYLDSLKVAHFPVS